MSLIFNNITKQKRFLYKAKYKVIIFYSFGFQVMQTQCFAYPPIYGNQSHNGDRAWVPNIAILITVGASDVHENKTIPMASRAKRSGIHITAVGVSDQIDLDELKGIASGPLDVINVTHFSEIPNQLNFDF